ncbi:MAG: threonine-phosphate decarboxylase CobD [Candidatus Omnitrophica bacterium]|jgi:threonine-phosphate decarboxylase|nr:threonine-phosphate decarboxylase CobD [Candidatus Omnitrophota bacterium]
MIDQSAHGGNIRQAAREFGLSQAGIIDFSAGINPFELPEGVKKAVYSSLRQAGRYPDTEDPDLKKDLAGYLGAGEENIVFGNGSADLIWRIVYALKPKKALVISPAFSEYRRALLSAGTKVRSFYLKEKEGFSFCAGKVLEASAGCGMVILSNPNNPTGALVSGKELRELAAKLESRKTILVLDEAFIDLAEKESLTGFACGSGNLIVLRSLTKFFGLAGLRFGCAVSCGKQALRLRECGQPWPVNVVAQAAARAVIREKGFIRRSRALLLEEKEFLFRRINRIKGLRPFPPHANFLLVKIESDFSAAYLRRSLAKRGLLIRDCGNFPGLGDKYFRAAVRGRRDNLKLLAALEKLKW